MELWPDFAPHGLTREKLAFTPRDLLGFFPKDLPFLWLTSGERGRHMALLGERWKLEGTPTHWHWKSGSDSTLASPRQKGDYPKVLDDIHQKWLAKQVPEAHCGLFLAYESGWDLEQRRGAHENLEIPECLMFCPLEILIFESDGQAWSWRDERQPTLLLQQAHPQNPNFAVGVTVTCAQSEALYLEQAQRVIEHIRAGNSFQVNLSQEFNCAQKPDVFSWARHALSTQPAPFCAFLNHPIFQVLSLSPERLLQQNNMGHLITRPIAGTLPRKGGLHLDDLEAFRTNPKECAEHNMLIDLERNDLGKVCKVGTVRVEEYLTIETLPHVHHLVSQVGGDLDEGIGPGTAIFATFPGGTITGCPKLETMHILDELECGNRGAYTGSMGYFCRDHFDTNILIRSAQIDSKGVKMRFGGGIVWDSIPEKEFLETLAKARGLIRSLLEGGAELDPNYRPLRQLFA
jgi:anthranilate synthase component I